MGLIKLYQLQRLFTIELCEKTISFGKAERIREEKARSITRYYPERKKEYHVKRPTGQSASEQGLIPGTGLIK
jgi:hypothetical protein